MVGKRIESLDDPEFGRLFTSFGHTAYRLELLPNYDVGYEDESYREFLAGEDPWDPSQDQWAAVLSGAAEAGKTFARVHVISEPLTPYLQYEMRVWYPLNTDAGDDIRIMPAAEWGHRSEPDQDYWLFDSRDLWVMEYDGAGRFLGCELVTDPAEVVRHCYWRDAAMHYAMPFAKYMATVPALRRAS